MGRAAWRLVIASGLAAAVAAPAVMAVVPPGQEGSLDTSFGSAGFAVTSYGTWAAAAADVVQPDGKIVTAGETLVGGVYEIIATRMTSGGQLDPSFGNGGIVTVQIGGSGFGDSSGGL